MNDNITECPRCKGGVDAKLVNSRRSPVAHWVSTRYTCRDKSCRWGGKTIESQIGLDNVRDLAGEREEIREMMSVSGQGRFN